ncbi:Hypothetical predicted protein [Scomber scombrus]|uniref:Uncharacterized protein n=1 Tax=Scomber scombrus TaxID=13677 RepID=A0AAV1PMC2_SCOSC
MPFLHSDRSVSLSHGHRVQDASHPCCFLTQNAAFRLDRDIGHHDASDPCCFLTPTAAFHLDRDIGHHDASDPCCFLKSNSSASLSHGH